jgi:hypothetical protein
MVLLLAKNCAAVVQGLVVVVVEDDDDDGGGNWRCMVVVVVVVCVFVGVRLRDVSIQVVWGIVVVVVDDDEEACDDATVDPNTDPHALWWRTCIDGTIIKGAGLGRFCSDCTGDDDVNDDDQQ